MIHFNCIWLLLQIVIPWLTLLLLTSLPMEEVSAIIKSYIAEEKPRDESLALSLQDLNEEAFCATFAVGPLTNDPLITFQIFFSSQWSPLVCRIRW